ncbi:MAG: mechanosensitive ion channel family protein [Kiritimatiellae bacterium]|jgi:small-conductance mechanosensitive channel|nr:mechanosensitive ion channel family protein [Kiritimatiellia bacterium]
MSVDVALEWMKNNSADIIGVILLCAALPVVFVLSRLFRRAMAKRISAQMAMLISKALSYIALSIIVISIFRQLGVKLTPLLGAAGIMGVAIGFAAQTSLSNLISGVFLILEQPFQVGDLVRVDENSGRIHSIDLLSVKIRTFDNTLIRVPNETMLKTTVTNVTAFPIRRFDIVVGVAYKENLKRVKEILLDVANSISVVLDEPEPFFLFKGFAESSIEIQLGVWFIAEDYVMVRNRLIMGIKTRFDKEGIEIPFPHRSIYTGLASQPFPVRVVEGDPDQRAPIAAGQEQQSDI